MKTLQLYYPAKPYNISQRWGIYNPAYLQFGFSRHNGEDFLLGKDNRTHAPFKARVFETGFNSGAGNFIRIISTEKLLVGGIECYVGAMFMHHEQILAKEGQILEVGDIMGIPDNTGFSTGPHTHGSFFRLKGDYWTSGTYDTDKETNYSFDPHPYWTGFAAQDYQQVWIIQKLIDLFKQLT